MMKSRTVFYTLILLLALVIAACGGDDSTEEPTETATETATVTVTASPQGTATTQAPQLQTTAAASREESAEAQDLVGDVAEGEMDAEPMEEPIGGVVAPPNPVTAPLPQAPIAPTPIPDMTFQDPGTNPFLDTEDDNLSTFALDVDSASFTVARNYLLTRDQYPPEDAIRPEEFINYFNAGYDSPTADDAFAIYLDAAPAPFGFDDHYVMRVGVQGRYIAPEDRDPVFLVFVIDVSGSMDMENRLGLVKESLALLLEQLREDDRVGIVVYSDNSRVVLEPTPASEQNTISDAIDALRPEGSTNVQAGLSIGYQLAADHMRDGENTRVIVLSDGVANVGATGSEAILETISENTEKGIALSTIGFGMGNYNDVLMEQLANDGNGNYYYVDEIGEAERVFVHNLTGTLQVIAYDAKIQVEFNPEVADRYRLIGYENRAIADEDFRNDTVDAGEVGAGQNATAIYELALESTGDDAQFVSNDVIATVYVRYEDAETREIVEVNQSITVGDLLEDMNDAPQSFQLQVAVAEFAELLGGSFWAEEGSYGDVMRLLQSAELDEENEEIATLMEMVRAAIRYEDR